MTDDPDDSRDRWNGLFSQPRFAPVHPEPAVIRWLFRTFPRDEAATVSLLDAGSGTGRHGLLAAAEGYRTTVADFSAVAVAEALRVAADRRLSLVGAVASMDRLPFAGDTFDGVLSYGVLYYLSYPRLRAAVAELYRVLKPGGRAFVVIKSADDSRGRYGTPLGDHGVRLDRSVDGMSWGKELGLTLTLLDRAGLEACFSAFDPVVVDRSTVTFGNGRFQDEEWHLVLGKGPRS
jgi:SAM-dependent methyltransferase